MFLSRAALPLTMMALLAACAIPESLMDADELTIFPRGLPNTFSMIGTNALPMGMKATVTHHVEHMGDADGFREASYNTLSYIFSFPSGRDVSASVSLDGLHPPQIVRCREAGQTAQLMAATCHDWPEFRQTVLTMLALDHFIIEVFGNEGYQAVDLATLGIADADVDEWIRLCTEASLRHKQ